MSFARQCISNLHEYYSNCQDTGIRMSFYHATDFTKPKMETAFRKWVAQNGQTYYLCEGIHCTERNKVIDIYEDVALQDFVTGANQNKANTCSHLDFGICEQRIPANALFTTHSTHYACDFDCMNLRKVSHPYNFVLMADDCNDVISFYQSLLGNGKLQRTYNNDRFKALLELCTISVGLNNDKPCNIFHTRIARRWPAMEYLITLDLAG